MDDTGREVKAAVGREEDESEAEARTTWQKSKESSPKRPSAIVTLAEQFSALGHSALTTMSVPLSPSSFPLYVPSASHKATVCIDGQYLRQVARRDGRDSRMDHTLWDLAGKYCCIISVLMSHSFSYAIYMP